MDEQRLLLRAAIDLLRQAAMYLIVKDATPTHTPSLFSILRPSPPAVPLTRSGAEAGKAWPAGALVPRAIAASPSVVPKHPEWTVTTRSPLENACPARILPQPRNDYSAYRKCSI